MQARCCVEICPTLDLPHHHLLRFMIFLTARFCFFLSWRAAQPAEVRARLLLISKKRKLGWWESPSKRRIPTSRGWKSIAPCRASLTPRNEDQGRIIQPTQSDAAAPNKWIGILFWNFSRSSTAMVAAWYGEISRLRGQIPWFRSHPIKSTLYWLARVKNSSNTWVATSGDLATTLFKWALPKVTPRTPQSWGAFNWQKWQ